MDDREALAERFEASRPHLRQLAYRMLGSASEADDAVQEAWLRLSRSDASAIEDMRRWLTTVVARVCLDMLRSRRSRREEPITAETPEQVASGAPGINPEDEAVLADSVGLALIVVLETLTPAERVAFVLHDMFDLSFDEIAPIVGRSPGAARQLASRGRRRVRGAGVPSADRGRQHRLVDAFLAAARGGDFAALLAVLDPDVVLRADRAAVLGSAARQAAGAPRIERRLRGAAAVAEAFAGRAAAAQPALIDGAPGLVWAPGGRPRAVIAMTIEGDRIVGIDVIADQEHIDRLDLQFGDG